MLVQVHVKRSVLGAEDVIPSETDKSSYFVKPPKPLVRKNKLVLVDLAGSERVHKSGAYHGPFISFQWLVNCILYFRVFPQPA